MRSKLALWSAAAVLAVGAGTASADFKVLTSRTVNSTPGFDLIVLSALNDGTNGSGTNFQSLDVTVTEVPPVAPNAYIQFAQADVDGDGQNDIDISGSTVATKSWLRVGSKNSWFLAAPFGADAPFSDTNGDTVYTPGQDPGGSGTVDRSDPTTDPIWSQAKTFRVVGFNTTAPTANVTPVKFGQILVPTGTAITVSGQLASSTAPLADFTPVTDGATPEPATLSFLGLGGIAILGRRRRKA